MLSARLRYQPVDLAHLDDFHRLVQDPHVLRYLMDGNVFPREWTEQRIRDSQALFQRRGVGLWLAYIRQGDELLGFCGFLEIPSIHPEPQLVYALFQGFTGQGYATEMGQEAIAHARTQPGLNQIFSGVDAVNAASVRVLDKLGFQRVAVQQGSFGDMLLLRLDTPAG